MFGKSYQDAKYQIEVSFKDGKYKFDVIELYHFVNSSQYVSGGWYPISLNEKNGYFRKNGKIDSNWKTVPQDVSDYFNNLNKGLFDFINGQGDLKKKNDW